MTQIYTYVDIHTYISPEFNHMSVPTPARDVWNFLKVYFIFYPMYIICIYIYIYVRIYVHIHTYISNIYTYIYQHKYDLESKCIGSAIPRSVKLFKSLLHFLPHIYNMYIRIYVYVRIHVHIYTCNTNMYIRTYTHINITLSSNASSVPSPEVSIFFKSLLHFLPHTYDVCIHIYIYTYVPIYTYITNTYTYIYTHKHHLEFKRIKCAIPRSVKLFKSLLYLLPGQLAQREKLRLPEFVAHSAAHLAHLE